MKICFIADASSIHLQRIIAYYVRQKDQLLVLSTARSRTEIPGAQVVHLIAKSGQSAAPKSQAPFWHRVVPAKTLLSRIKRDIRVLRSRAKCAAHIRAFDPDVFFCLRSFPEGFLAKQCGAERILLRTAGADISRLTKFPIYRQLIRSALRAASVVVTESEWEKARLHKLCGPDLRVEVIVIGVDTELFRPMPI